MHLEVSYDDGAPGTAPRCGAPPTAGSPRLDAPRTTRFVTLRAAARDRHGNSVRQSVVRAFGLK
ncbi:hypothetical protein AB0N88_20775 [Streptomyces sp. NPDC093516]|uniref:hypothetical protein n=1 Tax=Streptomyces sp. NPDC093516 TaxID=3155304 RepID=UPI00343BF342